MINGIEILNEIKLIRRKVNALSNFLSNDDKLNEWTAIDNKLINLESDIEKIIK